MDASSTIAARRALPGRALRIIALVAIAIGFAGAVIHRAVGRPPGKTAAIGSAPTREASASGCSPRPAEIIALGEITAGGCAEAQFRVDNPSDSWIEVARVETSCPCLTVEFGERLIAPHESITAVVRLDLAQDRDFTGGLCPELQLFDSRGEYICHRIAHANVVSRLAGVTASDRRSVAVTTMSDR